MKMYVKIAQRIMALFTVSALTTIGAGAIIGMDTAKTALLAGVMGVANVIEDLARGYLNDGKLDKTEIEAAFANNTPAKKSK